ncbi:RidA family protein [Acidobacteria bacterium ACD]|nr:MAG: RidA family protein [Acidobacteriota bacterium]MCE7959623.1 RidA family protein [Acidobacteria bacterium ACB2]MDL1951542.1 RidA family protein [Acidobacteria bacterium ACD]
MRRTRVETDSPWERRFGYARAVRAGSFVAVSGTVAADGAGLPLARDPYGQAAAVFRKIGEALGRVGGSLSDVVRLRVHYVSPDVASGFLEALNEAFPAGAPALTTVRVAELVGPEYLLEVEADAVLEEAAAPARREERPPGWDQGED